MQSPDGLQAQFVIGSQRKATEVIIIAGFM